MFITFAEFGMGHTSSRYIAAYRNTNPTGINGINSVALLFSALTGFSAAVVLFVAAPFIATTLFNAPELAGPLRMVAPVLFLCAISGAIEGTIRGFEAFQRLARLLWASSLMNFMAVVAGVMLWGLWGALIGLVGSELLRCVVTMWVGRGVMQENGFRLFARARAFDAKILWRFSLPLLLSSILHIPIIWLCQTMIARQPNGLSEIALYDAAQKWMTIVMLVPIAASAAFGPVLANLSGTADTSVHRRTTIGLAAAQLVLTAVPAAIVALAAPWAVLIFGPDFAAASPIVMIMMALAPIFVLGNLYWQALTSRGQAWASVFITALSAAVTVSLTWALRTEGAASLAKARLVAQSVDVMATIVVIERLWRRDVSVSDPGQPRHTRSKT